jgi:hypothetical protein
MNPFAKQQYINVETFRRSGVGVQTPVWFVEDGNQLYVRTIKDSGKVKRIRNNSRVRVAPCDGCGNLCGEWQEAQARIATASEDERIERLLKKKYGLVKGAFDLMGRFNRSEYVSLAINLEHNGQGSG